MDGIITGRQAEEYGRREKHNRWQKENTFLSRVVKKNCLIADFACGSGISIEFLKSKAKVVYGIDASVDMIEICKKRFKEELRLGTVKLIVADASSTGLAGEMFDYVVVRMGLHHIKNKQGVIEEAHRILKNNGELLIIDKFRMHNKLVTFAYDVIRNLARGYRLLGHHYITHKEMNALLATKFQIKSCYSHPKGMFERMNIVCIKCH